MKVIYMNILGDFDENDMGKDGHAMFIVNYEGKRHLGK
jgi:hypothetical protein